jgi:hypothetical protein
METETTNILADAIKEYYGDYELEELCNQFNIEMDYLGVSPNHVKLANRMVVREHQNYQQLLEKIMPELFERCNHRILNSTWESNAFDNQMLQHLKKLKFMLSRGKKSIATNEPVNHIFKSLKGFIKFFSQAKSAVTVVDTHIGTITLECVKQVQQPIRLLTGIEEQTFPEGFNETLKKFCGGGRQIEIRRHVVLNDRYVFLNGRCWMLSSSLNSVRSKPVSIIECIDAKSSIAKALESKWREAEIYQF